MPLGARARGFCRVHVGGSMRPRRRGGAGEVRERLMRHAWKACVRVTAPRVRIPPSPSSPAFQPRSWDSWQVDPQVIQFVPRCAAPCRGALAAHSTCGAWDESRGSGRLGAEGCMASSVLSQKSAHVIAPGSIGVPPVRPAFGGAPRGFAHRRDADAPHEYGAFIARHYSSEQRVQTSRSHVRTRYSPLSTSAPPAHERQVHRQR